MNTILLTNARIVTPAGHFMGTVSIDNGIITGIYRDKFYPEGIDLRGQWLIPGCIDIHTDYLEKELHPRPSANFGPAFAQHFLDVRAASCGLTTVFCAISFSNNESKSRSIDEAVMLARQIEATRDSTLVRHYLHARVDPNTDLILPHLAEMAELESMTIVVFNDTIPGTRQYTMEQHIEMRMQGRGITREEAVALLTERFEVTRQVNHREVIRETFSGKAILGSHDDTTEDHIMEAAAYGVTLAEMPTTLAAARKAKEMGMWVCMGAPNYYRGGSHCGNLSCEEAMDEGLVDILCSDYHFPTVLGSVVRMIDDGVEPETAVNMVSLNPARMLGLSEHTGSIEVGKRADLVAFAGERSFAAVSQVWVDGNRKFSAEYNKGILPLAR
ncbi:MAG TPA: alpha-D-ribose 1-methylphosphonate 5-triphosphate diphosphatase [Puia sp.]|jgi:alpha-D-ribose 1-methylphosphonate 5-triphosphate diphosphatase|nr:alpha-D-ribose 1-methylphosphonate 5-triphosphate diphosphatase [Puia sp.]